MSGPSKVIVLDPDVRSGRQISLGFAREGVPAAVLAVPVDAGKLVLRDDDEPAVMLVGGTNGRAVELLKRARALLDERGADVPVVFTGHGVERREAEAAGADEILRRPAYLRDVVTIGRLLRGVPSGQRDHLVGSLVETTGVYTLVRAFAALGRSAVLTLIRGLRRGEVRFYRGEVTSAQVGLIHGQAALHQLLLWTDARFDYHHEDIVRRQQIPLAPDELFADAERFLEGVRESAGGLSPAMVLEQDVQRVQNLGKQIPTEVHGVLRMFDGHRVLADVLEDSPYRVFETLRVAQKAVEVGLLRAVEAQRPKATWRAVLAIEEWLTGSETKEQVVERTAMLDTGPVGKVGGGGTTKKFQKRRKRKKQSAPPIKVTGGKTEIDWGALVPRVIGGEVGPLSGVVPAAAAKGEIDVGATATRDHAREGLEALMDTGKRERIFPTDVGLEPSIVVRGGESGDTDEWERIEWEAKAREKAAAEAAAAAAAAAPAVAAAPGAAAPASTDEVSTPVDAEARTKSEAEHAAQAAAEAKARADAEARAKARADAEARARAEAEERAKAELEAAARADAEAEAQAKAAAEAEAKAKAAAEAEAQAKAAVEAKARADAEAQAKAAAEAQAKADADAKARADADAKAKADAEAKAKADAEAKANADAEAKAKADADAKAKADAASKTSAPSDAKDRDRVDRERGDRAAAAMIATPSVPPSSEPVASPRDAASAVLAAPDTQSAPRQRSAPSTDAKALVKRLVDEVVPPSAAVAASATSAAPTPAEDEPSDGVVRSMIATADTARLARARQMRPPGPEHDGPPIKETTGEIRPKPPTMPPPIAAATDSEQPSILVADLGALHAAVSSVAEREKSAPPTPDAASASRELVVAEVRKDAIAATEVEEAFFSRADTTGAHHRPSAPHAESFDDLDEGYEPPKFWDRVFGRKKKPPPK